MSPMTDPHRRPSREPAENAQRSCSCLARCRLMWGRLHPSRGLCHAPGINEAGRLEEGVSLLPVKYTDELKARAVELVIHAQADPETANGAITRVAKELGLSKETLRVWVRKHKDSGKATPTESVDLEAEGTADGLVDSGVYAARATALW
ncbi:hypothetical protein ETC03_17905 [Geobacillus sp. MMMUD3]|nr:hypothetical protein [Geobacillus sp. MMMUD3]